MKPSFASSVVYCLRFVNVTVQAGVTLVSSVITPSLLNLISLAIFSFIKGVVNSPILSPPLSRISTRILDVRFLIETLAYSIPSLYPLSVIFWSSVIV
jgi:hypothetical protein